MLSSMAACMPSTKGLMQDTHRASTIPLTSSYIFAASIDPADVSVCSSVSSVPSSCNRAECSAKLLACPAVGVPDSVRASASPDVASSHRLRRSDSPATTPAATSRERTESCRELCTMLLSDLSSADTSLA
eukprot:234502-Hanusia_phi.AAC.1